MGYCVHFRSLKNLIRSWKSPGIMFLHGSMNPGGCILKNFKPIKFKMAAYRPLFTSTGLILRNIMKTAQDSYTITIKQIVSFQEGMHL